MENYRVAFQFSEAPKKFMLRLSDDISVNANPTEMVSEDDQ